MPADLTAEILQLGGSSRPDEQLGRPDGPRPELQALALERAGWWRSFASFGATPGQSRVAHVVHRAYFLLWQELKGQLPTGPPGELAGGPQPPGPTRVPAQAVSPPGRQSGRRRVRYPGSRRHPGNPQPQQPAPPPVPPAALPAARSRRRITMTVEDVETSAHRGRAEPHGRPARRPVTTATAPCSTCSSTPGTGPRAPGVWERLAAGLEPLGITVLRPDGERFDPAIHEAGGVEPTDDDALVGTIAETELVGFADRGRLVREPVVVVYRRG